MKKKLSKISYGKNVYDNKEINAVIKTLKKTTQMGESVSAFEKKVSKIFSKKYGLMVNSGSSALILALKVMNFKKGSEIIAPSLNFGTAVSSIMSSSKSSSLFIISSYSFGLSCSILFHLVHFFQKLSCRCELNLSLPDRYPRRYHPH